MSTVIKPRLTQSLRQLRLPAIVSNYAAQAALASNEGWPYDQYLLNLCELEVSQRESRRINRLLIASKLPSGKTLASYDRTRLPAPVNRKFDVLLEADFLDRRENVLAFGNPGSGKTHLMTALGHELVKKGRAIYFTSCSMLVQRLLKVKTELNLEKELRRLDKFDALIIDDIGYVQQSREEMEVLFTLLAHRYEHRSVLLLRPSLVSLSSVFNKYLCVSFVSYTTGIQGQASPLKYSGSPAGLGDAPRTIVATCPIFFMNQ